MRAALVRYGQPEAQRVSDILDLVRRVEWVLHDRHAQIAATGAALWARLEGDDSIEADDFLVGVLRATRQLDQLADALAEWAVDRAGAAPHHLVDTTVTQVREQLDALGVPVQEQPPEAMAARRRGRG